MTAFVALAVTLVTSSCRQPEVLVSFRPPVGAEYRYEVRVTRTVDVRLGTEPADRSTDTSLLHVDNTVVNAAPGEVRMQVRLRRPNSPDRTFIVRFDRGAQLAAVEAVERLPAEVLGEGTFPEFLPAAVAAPPDRPIAPGERWNVTTQVELPNAPGARLQSQGQLVALKRVGDGRVASIRSETRLEGLSSTTQLRGATALLRGTENTETVASRSATDGAVQEATSETTGRYEVVLSPPAGEGPPVTGTVSIEVRSETRRVAPPAQQTRR